MKKRLFIGIFLLLLACSLCACKSKTNTHHIDGTNVEDKTQNKNNKSSVKEEALPEDEFSDSVDEQTLDNETSTNTEENIENTTDSNETSSNNDTTTPGTRKELILPEDVFE